MFEYNNEMFFENKALKLWQWRGILCLYNEKNISRIMLLFVRIEIQLNIFMTVLQIDD